jgi:MtfA peptidase
MWKEQRRRQLQSSPISSDWRRIVEARCPFYHRLPELDRAELEGHIKIFLAEKKFEWCGGLTISDEIKVCIAANASLLLLHRDADYYPGLQTILVYPGTYYAPTIRHIGSGVMEESHQPRAGESWRAGAVVLSWNAICSDNAAPESGHNVVLHEFAHQLDYEDGEADGVPLLGKDESFSMRKKRYADWRRVMGIEYERLQAQVQRGESTVLDEYGASNPAEFFAVATETFFGKPLQLRQKLPELYEELKWYYRQDPAQWLV